MGTLKEQLIANAISQHRKIFPCVGRHSLEDCFTFEKGRIVFWFNTEDHSTHMMLADVE